MACTQRLTTAAIGLLLTLAPCASRADIDPQEYARFLADNARTTAHDLRATYGQDAFLSGTATDFAAAGFADSVRDHFGITDFEALLLDRHGFVVSERVRPTSFGAAFLDIYTADLPLFVSSDAILHALHMSYDAALMDLEREYLLPELRAALRAMHGALPELHGRYAGDADMATVLLDAEIFLSVPLRLLGERVNVVDEASVVPATGLLADIDAEQVAARPLFGDPGRTLDFSQFRVRGHYTQDPALGPYFQAMMWLGRTELYTDMPKGVALPPPPEAIIRQILLATLLDELAVTSGADLRLAGMERLLRAFVGDQDNLSLEQLRVVRREAGISDPRQLLDPATRTAFQARLREGAQQKILSQILLRDPLSPAELQPAPAFLLIGQRFLIDSYIFANVVYDKTPSFRGLPSSLDALFALGNDTAVQLLGDELETYGYAPNLAALRFLVDAQKPDFWERSLYNGWLQAIRTLSPPSSRDHLPAFMQTHAWWQHKMSSQLAAWAQLRHDNLLYGKQSYTAGIVCEYPETYIEPVPAFYDAVARFARHAESVFGNGGSVPSHLREGLGGYFGEMASIADTLAGVARKELAGEAPTPAEALFLKTVLYDVPSGCTTAYLGWYSRLYYTGEEGLFREDLVVADVHTQPTDAGGTPVGKILHVGTGPLDLAVVVAPASDGCQVAFSGPVMSFYEHVTVGFERLTDEEWRTVYTDAMSYRPDYVNLYLADTEGTWRGEATALATAVTDKGWAVQDTPATMPAGPALQAVAYPNPFNGQTLIAFTVAPGLAAQPLEVAIYNASGQRLRTLLREPLRPGAYSIRWDGRDDGGSDLASGVYLYRITFGAGQTEGRLTLLR